MIFREITKDEYIKFWNNHPNKFFLSSYEITKLRKKSGWDYYIVGIEEKNKIIAASIIYIKKKFLKYSEAYSPRGYLLDYKNIELVDFFTKNLIKFLKSKNVFIFRTDPYIIYQERDIDGNIVENGINNETFLNKLKSYGFKRIDPKYEEQVSWMFSLDLDKTSDEILKNMRQNTRNTIRKTEKIGINLKELKKEELDLFYNILKETGERKDFKVRDISYYKDMYDLFSKDIKFFITELDLDKYIDNLLNEKKELEEKVNKLSKKNKGQINEINSQINTLDKKINEAKEIIKKENKSVINLSASMFILIKPEIVYLSSGNYEEYLKFNSQYLIQWELIKYGIKNGYKKHNFYGIPANINTHPKDYGIYEFKKGFNGYVEELIGELELPVNNFYYIYKFLKKIKK